MKQCTLTIADAMIEAEHKAWQALAGYKFYMFGYHAAQWVLLNKLTSGRSEEQMANPFRALVSVARDELRSRNPKSREAVST